MTLRARQSSGQEARVPRPRRRAFSLIELLVVISIFVLVLAIAVPALLSMLYNSEQSLSENAMRQAMGSARDVAARNAAGEDAAAVFFFEPGQRASIVVYVRAGSLRERPDRNADIVEREIFVPARGVEPVQMPPGWTVRGFAGPGTLDDRFYADTYASGLADRNEGNWVLPETGFFNPAVGPAAYRGIGRGVRSTFMVRFEGGSGRLITSSSVPVYLLAASPSAVFRTGRPWSITGGDGRPYLRVDQDDDALRFVRRVLEQPTAEAPPPAAGTGTITVLSQGELQSLVGAFSPDVVIAKPVTTLAVLNEARLAAGVGVRPDRATGALVAFSAPVTGTTLVRPAWVEGNAGPWSLQDTRRVNAWIEARTLSGLNIESSDARIFTLQRYLGTLQELTGTRQGQGVTQ